jgi:hypothetical protein
MATITPTKQDVAQTVAIWTWAALTAANDTGVALGKNFMDFVDRSVQIAGTFDGATVILEGSNDGTNYRPLTDPQGNDISKTSASLEQITESVLHARPRLTGAGGSTSITVTIAARKTR